MSNTYNIVFFIDLYIKNYFLIIIKYPHTCLNRVGRSGSYKKIVP